MYNYYMIKEEKSNSTGSGHFSNSMPSSFHLDSELAVPLSLSILFTIIHSCFVKHLRAQLCHASTLAQNYLWLPAVPHIE